MDIGALRHRVTLQNPTTAADGDGGFADTWPPAGGTTLGTFWASIVPATAHDLERVVAGTVQSSATHILTLRYLQGVTTKTRALFGTREFHVTGVQNPDERNISLVLICQEIVP